MRVAPDALRAVRAVPAPAWARSREVSGALVGVGAFEAFRVSEAGDFDRGRLELAERPRRRGFERGGEALPADERSHRSGLVATDLNAVLPASFR